MKDFFKKVLSHRFGPAALLTIILVAISMLTRTALLIVSAREVSFTFLHIVGLYGIGFFYDLVNASYFIIPLVLYLWLMPTRWFAHTWQQGVLIGLFFLLTIGLIFNSVSEWFFWDEFNTRYNFIAVDYLVYTTEVIGNIRQSYPIEWIVSVEVLLALGVIFFIRPFIKLSVSHIMPFGKRSLWVLAILLLPTLFFFTVNNKIKQFSNNA